jgi:hypothetical protein
VIEVSQPDKATRCRRGKSDTLNAEAAARVVLSGRASGNTNAGDGSVESQANSALYRIAICRPRCDARTRDYLAREIYQIVTFPAEAEPSAA